MESHARLNIDMPSLSSAEIAARLHDTAIHHLEEAISAIESGEIERRCHAINFVAEIIATMHLAIDFEHGGQVSDRLGAIYRFVMASLFRINLYDDEELAAKMIEVLEPLGHAWKAISSVQYANDAAQQTTILGQLESASQASEAVANL